MKTTEQERLEIELDLIISGVDIDLGGVNDEGLEA